MRTTSIILSCLLALKCVQAHAQIYDQAALLQRLPRIPATVIGVNDEAKETFREQVNACELYLDSLLQHYKHPMCSLEKASQQEMFEFNLIWEDLYRQHENYYNTTMTEAMEQMNDLLQEVFDRQAELSDEIRNIRQESIKTMKDISGDENRIDKAMYDNHARYSQKRAEILTNHIKGYQSLIETLAAKAKRADTILLENVI